MVENIAPWQIFYLGLEFPALNPHNTGKSHPQYDQTAWLGSVHRLLGNSWRPRRQPNGRHRGNSRRYQHTRQQRPVRCPDDDVRDAVCPQAGYSGDVQRMADSVADYPMDGAHTAPGRAPAFEDGQG